MPEKPSLDTERTLTDYVSEGTFEKEDSGVSLALCQAAVGAHVPFCCYQYGE